MNRLSLLLLSALLLAPSFAPGATLGLSLDQVQSSFIEGKQHYEKQEFNEAIERYNAILQSGYHAPELFHNLGNAYFRKGDIGRSILNYRRASRLAPMDSAIKANMQFAQKQTGAVIPPTPIWHAPVQVLSRQHWLIGLIATWWACALLSGIWLWHGRRSDRARQGVLILASLVALFGLGALCSSLIHRQAEVVIVADEVEALFAPLTESVAHFSLPEGSVAAMVEQGDRWLKIQSGKESGWIPAEACESIHPW